MQSHVGRACASRAGSYAMTNPTVQNLVAQLQHLPPEDLQNVLQQVSQLAAAPSSASSSQTPSSALINRTPQEAQTSCCNHEKTLSDAGGADTKAEATSSSDDAVLKSLDGPVDAFTLCRIIEKGALELAVKIIETHGVKDVNELSEEGWTPLHWALHMGSTTQDPADECGRVGCCEGEEVPRPSAPAVHKLV